MAGSSLKQSLLVLTKTNDELAAEFQLIDDFDGVAALLALTPSQLYHYTHSGQRYYIFAIAKKHGGTRTIQAPKVGLKLAQRKLNQVLQAMYSPNSVVQGFVSQRNVVSNASLHTRKRFILNLDLENFFGTITFARVRGMFMAKPYLKNPTVATILARLCCCGSVLAQGSPTSPVVSNMIVSRMDSQLKTLARANKCTYSRYADDLTFSTFQKQFPRSLAFFDEGDEGGCLKVGTPLSELVTSNGFRINGAKTRLQHYSGRQV